MMAEEEAVLASPPTKQAAVHVRDYEHFTKLFKWGAIIAFLVGLTVLMILGS
jgi:hypothetical protein